KCGRDRPAAGRDGRRSLRDGLGGGNVPGVEQDERIPLPVKTVKRLGVLLLCRGVHRPYSWSDSVGGVRLEPVHDQTGDFVLALEVREVTDIGQDNSLVWLLQERLLLDRIPRCRIVPA